MGKSFNDDVFNNDFNLDTINGLNISQEAIRENKKNSTNEAIQQEEQKLKDEALKKLAELKEQEKKALFQKNIETLLEDVENKKQSSNSAYVKKTMIFKQDYLDIINGLAIINDMQIKDVLNQLLEKSINMLDDKTREKALKNGKKQKSVKQEKSIF